MLVRDHSSKMPKKRAPKHQNRQGFLATPLNAPNLNLAWVCNASVSTHDQQTISLPIRAIREFGTPPWFFRDGDSFVLAGAVVRSEL